MKNNKRGGHIAVVMLACVMAAMSCTYRKAETTVVPEVLFSRDILPILGASCSINSGCHAGARNSGNNINLDDTAAYNSMVAKKLLNFTQPTAGLLYVEISNGIMPKAPYVLSATEKALVISWITQGGKNN